MKIFKILIILSILSSCASVSNYPDEAFGDKTNYQKKVKSYILATAKDPDSIKILAIGEAKKTFIQNTAPSALWNPYFPVLGVCVMYKGANSYGANRVTTENFFIRNNVVLYDIVTLDRYEPCLMK